MLRGHLREAAAEAATVAADARRLGAPTLEAGAMNSEGFSRAALGDVEEGARLLHAAVDLASRDGTPADHVRAVINLSEMLDLSGRTDEALAIVRATLPMVREHAEPSSYDAFLETQAASELVRLGRTAEAAAQPPADRGGRPGPGVHEEHLGLRRGIDTLQRRERELQDLAVVLGVGVLAHDPERQRAASHADAQAVAHADPEALQEAIARDGLVGGPEQPALANEVAGADHVASERPTEERAVVGDEAAFDGRVGAGDAGLGRQRRAHPQRRRWRRAVYGDGDVVGISGDAPV
jgi:hypothetical protein